MAVFTPTITGLTSLTTENINIDNNSITALNSNLEQVSYTGVGSNLLLNSQEFDQSGWGSSRLDRTNDAAVAPDGTTTAWKMAQASGQTAAGYNQQYLTVADGVTYTYSAYAKAGTNRNFIIIRETVLNGSINESSFNLSTVATVNVNSDHTAVISDAGNGWYRCSITFTASGARSGNCPFYVSDGTGSVADNQGFNYMWGAQFEIGSTPSTYLTTTSAAAVGLTGVTRGTSGTTAATASSGGVITIGSVSTTLSAAITATQDYIHLASLTGVAASGTASIGTSNMDLNLSASGTGSVTINQIKTNSVIGEVIPGKLEGTNFTDSLLIGHSTTGTLSSADRNTGVGIEALDAVTAGDTNTAVGYQSGTLITYGQQNTSLGGVSLAANVSGGYNTSAGAYSLQKTTASNNTAFGYQAGKELLAGASNIFLGYQAGNNITTGSGNVVIGNGDVASATGDKQFKISDGVDGSVAWLTGDSSGNITLPANLTVDTNTLHVDSTNNRVGIGITSPATTLQIHNSGTTGGDHAYLNFTTGDTGSAYSDGLTVGVAATEQGQIIFRESNFLNIGSKLHTSFLSGSSLTERVRINSNGVMSVVNGIALGVGTATTASNVLDDYEEGTWTPVYRGNSSAGSYSANASGQYTKVGNKVYVNCHLKNITQNSAGSSTIQISGLPFVSSSSQESDIGSVYLNLFSFPTGDYVVATVNPGLSSVLFTSVSHDGSTATLSLSARNTDTADIFFSVTYLT